MEVFSARLKFLRKRKGYTQDEFAHLLGLSRPGYTKIEQGHREPRLETLATLPKLLGESLDFMLGVTDLDKHGEGLWNLYEKACFNVADLERDLKLIESPFSDESMLTIWIDPTDPSATEEKVALLKKNLGGWILRRNQMNKRLFNHLNDIPEIGEPLNKLIRELKSHLEFIKSDFAIDTPPEDANNNL